jgi:hypothetical protein
MRYLLIIVIAISLYGIELSASNTKAVNNSVAQGESVKLLTQKPLWSRVSKAGLFKVVRSGGIVDNPNSSTGKIVSKPVIELVKITNRIPLIKDAQMSLQYRIGNVPTDVHWLDLRRVLKHPKMTLPDGATTIGSDYMIKGKARVGQVIAYTGYSLNEDYEMIEGDWTFQIWHDDKKLIEHTFTTYWPDAEEIAQLGKL